MPHPALLCQSPRMKGCLRAVAISRLTLFEVTLVCLFTGAPVCWPRPPFFNETEALIESLGKAGDKSRSVERACILSCERTVQTEHCSKTMHAKDTRAAEGIKKKRGREREMEKKLLPVFSEIKTTPR